MKSVDAQLQDCLDLAVPLERYEAELPDALNCIVAEQSTWLSEILLEDFASVQMKAPAVSVAGEMTRHNASRCYVLNGKKLMGVINLPLFLNKVFRE